jgi:hypothetical protein
MSNLDRRAALFLSPLLYIVGYLFQPKNRTFISFVTLPVRTPSLYDIIDLLHDSRWAVVSFLTICYILTFLFLLGEFEVCACLEKFPGFIASARRVRLCT